MSDITVVNAAEDISACYPVMAQLRPHVNEKDFLERVRKQISEGYRLACLYDNGAIKSVAGFRIIENLAMGRHLYVDDLVTDENSRSKGYGAAMFDWLVDYAKTHSCGQLHLDSGVHRFGAHRFYLGKRMDITGYHFALALE